MPLTLSLSFSLPLVASLTRCLSPLVVSLTLLSPTRSLSHSFSVSFTRCLSHSLPLSLVLLLPRFVPLTHIHSCPPLHTRSRSHSLFLLLTPSLSHSLSLPLVGCLSHSFYPSLALFLSHTYSLVSSPSHTHVLCLTRSSIYFLLAPSPTLSLVVPPTRCLSPTRSIPHLALFLSNTFTRVFPLTHVLCLTHSSSFSLHLSFTHCVPLTLVVL